MALGHLHSLDIIYKSPKPADIFINSNGHICLKDYRHLDVYNYHGYEYMAPEIITNLDHSKSGDWWSLGILIYEFIVCMTPFYDANVKEVYRKIQESRLWFPSHLSISSQCKDLITPVPSISAWIASNFCILSIQFNCIHPL